MATPMNNRVHPLRPGHARLQHCLQRLHSILAARSPHPQWWELLATVRKFDQQRLCQLQLLIEYQHSSPETHWTVDALVDSIIRRLDASQVPLAHLHSELCSAVCNTEYVGANTLRRDLLLFKRQAQVALDLQESVLLKMLAMLAATEYGGPGLRLVGSHNPTDHGHPTSG